LSRNLQQKSDKSYREEVCGSCCVLLDEVRQNKCISLKSDAISRCYKQKHGEGNGNI
jgi:hypothetical protein